MLLLTRLRALVLFFAVAAFTLLAACDLRTQEQGGGRDTAAPPPDRPAYAPPFVAGAPEFAPGQLEQHFRKHGAEMGFSTPEEYLRAAQALVRGGPGVETWQRGRDTLYFREQTSEFAVVSDRNVLRTYFRPNDGRRYWERQKLR